MPRFREVSDTTARRIDRAMMDMAGLDTLEELEVRFLAEAAKIVPGDCLCWNNWATDWSQLINARLDRDYSEWFASQAELFNQVVEHHPVIKANYFQRSDERVMRMSDFQGYGQFKENPLFREIYRYLDSHFQIAYAACTLEDRKIILTWNRRALDFTERDRQIFHFMGLRLGVIARRIEERQHLERSWRALCGHIDFRMNAGSVVSLGAKDVDLLARIMGNGSRNSIAWDLGIRRDSVDKRLGSIRERLGLENHHQLLSALAGLRNPVG